MVDWQTIISAEQRKAYWNLLSLRVDADRASGIVYPPSSEVFTAFQLTSFESLKAVIVGQDPYINSGQAHGLAFSVKPSIPHPPSLCNILKEYQTDLGLPYPKSGCLVPWAKHGVLLLNRALTVKAGSSDSHRDIGWLIFTSAIIKAISDYKPSVIFNLWGSNAQQLQSIINPRHGIIKLAHPSPLSASRGFIGGKPFSRTNAMLTQRGQEPIDWILPG